MPDPAVRATDPDTPERDALTADARLVRAVRWRLVAWSGGVTLLVLLVTGAALYVAVERSLAVTATEELKARALVVARQIAIAGRPGPRPGFTFGDTSGTVTLVVAPDGETVVNLPSGVSLQPGFPVAGAVSSAQATQIEDVRTTTNADGVPIRVLSMPVPTSNGTFVIQVIQGRAEEQRTLDVTLRVLLVGGVIALLIAFGVGAVYANRALVPIRNSLTAQRVALRRQREFAADASHELRTPLTVIRTSVEHLERHPDERVGNVGSALEDIRAEVGQLTSLVDDLLLLARSDSGAVSLLRVPVDLGDIASDGASSLAASAADRGVHVVVDPGPAVVAGDPARLRQLVVLLVDNAIKHGPGGRTVTVRVRSTRDGATLVVEDEGRGIPAEHLPRVFDRFWRPPGSSGDGTGLGLAIAYWIATQHGGAIDAQNRPEGGARFTVRLPMAPRTGDGPPTGRDPADRGSAPTLPAAEDTTSRD